MDTATCPTCRQPLDPPPCDAIHPRWAQDVLPLRCGLEAGHPADHIAPPLWPGTPVVVW